MGEKTWVEELRWGEQVEEFRDTHGRFDIVVGCDVVYTESPQDLLWDTMDQLLTQDGVFLRGYCGRIQSVTDRLFFEAKRCGFEGLNITPTGPTTTGPASAPTERDNLSLYRFTRMPVAMAA